jgi:uncharacterized membrane protein
MSETPPTQDPIPTPDPVPTPTPTPTPMMSLGSGPSQEEKTQAMLSWFLSIVAGFIPPLIFFIIAADKPFVKRHAAMCLGLQIAATAVYIILFVTVVGILLVPVLGIVCLVFAIMGGLAANKGVYYDNMFKV